MLDLDHDDAGITAKSNEESLEIWILELNLRTRVEFCIIFTYKMVNFRKICGTTLGKNVEL